MSKTLPRWFGRKNQKSKPEKNSEPPLDTTDKSDISNEQSIMLNVIGQPKNRRDEISRSLQGVSFQQDNRSIRIQEQRSNSYKTSVNCKSNDCVPIPYQSNGAASRNSPTTYDSHNKANIALISPTIYGGRYFKHLGY